MRPVEAIIRSFIRICETRGTIDRKKIARTMEAEAIHD
jgi:hypothetical protein